MPGIFISYRREDSSGYAGRLFDILSGHFGRENTYMDLDTIRGGDNFVAVIDEKVSVCDALLVVIGERWLTSTGENGSRRLDAPGDFVRLEIAKALERGVPVIPILVGKGTMPQEAELPGDLRALALRQAMDVRDAHFREDAQQLIAVLEKMVHGAPTRTSRAKSNRTIAAVLAVIVIGSILAAFVYLRQRKPVSHAAPDAAVQRQAAAASVAAPPAQVASSAASQAVTEKPQKAITVPANVSGRWKATVTYDWPGAVYEEKFDFEEDGGELSGTASLLQGNHGLLEGKVDGNRVSFLTKSLTELGDKTYEDKHYYKGTVDGDTIRFSMLTDSGADSHVPIHFTARRVGAR